MSDLKKDVLVILLGNIVGLLLVWSKAFDPYTSYFFHIIILSFISGVLYTSFYFSPIGISLFFVLGLHGVNPYLVAALGAVGAIIGDNVLLHGVGSTAHSRPKRKSSLVKRIVAYSPAHWLVTALGSFLIIFPWFSDETGLELLKISKVRSPIFYPLVYVFHFVGIAAFLILTEALFVK